MGARDKSEQTIQLFQITPYVNDFQTLRFFQQSRFLTARRHLEKLVLPPIFLTQVFHL